MKNELAAIVEEMVIAVWKTGRSADVEAKIAGCWRGGQEMHVLLDKL